MKNCLKLLIVTGLVLLISADVHAKYGSQEKELFEAVRQGDVAAVENILEKKPGFFSGKVDLHALNERQETALFVINFDKPTAYEIAKALIKAGVDMDVQRYDGSTMLVFLADKYAHPEDALTSPEKENYIKVIRYLLAQGANRELQNNNHQNFASFLANPNFKKLFVKSKNKKMVESCSLSE